MKNSADTTDATRLLRNLRQTARDEGITIKGSKGLSDSFCAQIAALSERFNKQSAHDQLERMLMGTAVLARRAHMAIPQDLWPQIGATLLAEYTRNVRTLNTDKADATRLVPLTIFNGDVFCHAIQKPEYAEFIDTPGIFRHVAVNTPRYPEKTLRQVQKNMDDIQADPEFADFKDSRWILRSVSINNRKSPQDALRAIQKRVGIMAADPAFADVKPWVLISIALDYKNPAQAIKRAVALKNQYIHKGP